MKWLLLALLLPVTAFAASQNDTYRPVSGSLTVAYTAAVSVTTDSGFGTGTYAARVVCTTACFVAFGQSPIAVEGTVGSIYLPADFPAQFIVDPGQTVAVIALSSAGVLFVVELSR